MSYLWGIDLGGTKIEGAILDPATPDRPLCRVRVPTESAKGYEHIRKQIGRLLKTLSEESGHPLPKTIGIGTPGTLDPLLGTLRGSNSQCLNGQKLRDDLEADLGVAVVMANDANCFALAEAKLGCAQGYPTVFGVILGTGVGGGIVVHEQVLNGCHGIAGEWGQLILDPNGPVSVYGTQGTIEAYIAGPSLEQFYAEQAGEKRKLKDIVARVGTDEHARATIERLTSKFAEAISMIINVLDPHAIVLGGGVGNIDALYTPETRAEIEKHIFSPRLDAALLKPTLGDSAGVFGAAMLVG
jgi:predicted NBD/HSP70 family sugar kinase